MIDLKSLAEEFRLAVRNSSGFRPTDPEDWKWLLELSEKFFERVQEESLAVTIPAREEFAVWWASNMSASPNKIYEYFRDNIRTAPVGKSTLFHVSKDPDDMEGFTNDCFKAFCNHYGYGFPPEKPYDESAKKLWGETPGEAFRYAWGAACEYAESIYAEKKARGE